RRLQTRSRWSSMSESLYGVGKYALRVEQAVARGVEILGGAGHGHRITRDRAPQVAPPLPFVEAIAVRSRQFQRQGRAGSGLRLLAVDDHPLQPGEVPAMAQQQVREIDSTPGRRLQSVEPIAGRPAAPLRTV